MGPSSAPAENSRWGCTASTHGSRLWPHMCCSNMGKRASGKGLGQGTASTDRDAQDEALETPQLTQAPAATSSHLRSGPQENSFFLQTLQAASLGTARHACRQEEGFPRAALHLLPALSCASKRSRIHMGPCKRLLMARVGRRVLQGQKSDRCMHGSALPPPLIFPVHVAESTLSCYTNFDAFSWF